VKCVALALDIQDVIYPAFSDPVVMTVNQKKIRLEMREGGRVGGSRSRVAAV
jgi:hypothetical protein